MGKSRRIHGFYNRKPQKDIFGQRIRRRTGGRNRSASFTEDIDLIFNTNMHLTVSKGVYTLSGN
jgi:hypothetical protein